MTRHSSSDLLFLSAMQQARLIREGQVSSLELTDLYLDRITEYNDRLHAFVSVQAKRARKAARRADSMRSRSPQGDLPLFHGVPTGIKDLVPTKWSPTRLGSRAYRYFISPFDALVAQRIKAGGFISLGKLATSEFGAMPVTEPEIHPPTLNPWDVNRSSGGSSGGSSSAVSAHLIPIAHGSDGGGSVRIPSAFTHLYGFKPSLSLLGNLHGETYNRLGISVMGPLSRYVEDAAAMLDVMAGSPMQEVHADSCQSAIQKEPGDLRIRLLTNTSLGDIDPEILEATRELAQTLRSLGHTVEEGEAPPISLEDFLPIWRFAISGVRTLSDRSLQAVTRWLRAEDIQVTFAVAEARRVALAKRMEDAFKGADILLTPTVPSSAPLIGAFKAFKNPEDAFSEAARFGSLTAGFNITQGPAATIPIGLTKIGLPIGAQIGARVGKDHLILSLSRQIESALPWHTRRPSAFV